LEEIKSAASHALGSLATGNLAKYLPFLLEEITKEQKKQYLFLHALKEIISNQCDNNFSNADNVFQAGVGKIWKLLIDYSNSGEESIRNIVAECIGRYVQLQIKFILNNLSDFAL
jgi:cullin-associated NEDD8-dissociated protein 1